MKFQNHKRHPFKSLKKINKSKKQQKRKVKYIKKQHLLLNEKTKKEIINNQKIKKKELSKSKLLNSKEDWSNYYKTQMENTFQKIGGKIFKELLLKDKINESMNDILNKHSIDMNYRMSLIGYLFHITEINKIDFETYFLTINIFDYFLLKSKKNINNIESKKIIITCLYIAAKFESVNSITSEWISFFEINGSHFSALEIEEEEKEIYDTIGIAFYDNQYNDYIGILISDFEMNYKLYCENQNNKFEKIKSTFIYFLKLIPLEYSTFYLNKKFFLIITSMIYAFDFIKNQSKDFDNEYKVFHDWVIAILNSLKIDLKDTQRLYIKIWHFFENLYQNHMEFFQYKSFI